FRTNSAATPSGVVTRTMYRPADAAWPEAVRPSHSRIRVPSFAGCTVRAQIARPRRSRIESVSALSLASASGERTKANGCAVPFVRIANEPGSRPVGVRVVLGAEAAPAPALFVAVTVKV